MVGRATVFDSVSRDITVEFFTLRGMEPSVTAGSILLEVVGESAPNWTLDIQGKVHESGVYTNIDYVQVYQAGAPNLSNNQLTVTDTTRRFYLIPHPPPLIQLVSVRTAGNLTVHASYSQAVFAPLATGEPQVAFANITALGNTLLVGALTSPNRIIRVIGDKVVNSGSSVVAFKYQSDTTDIEPTDDLAADGGGWTRHPARGFLFETVAGKALNGNLGATGAVGISLQYEVVL